FSHISASFGSKDPVFSNTVFRIVFVSAAASLPPCAVAGGCPSFWVAHTSKYVLFTGSEATTSLGCTARILWIMWIGDMRPHAFAALVKHQQVFARAVVL